MRKVVWLAAILWASAAGALAQISVEVLLDQEQFLRDESLPVKVRISNRSGQTLKLGQQPDWLTFTIQRRDGYVVPRLGDPPVAGEVSLDSAMALTKTWNLLPYFELGGPGRYLVTATVHIKQWDREESSAPKSFEIIPGTKLWEEEIGVPTASGPPEVRKYMLQQANFRKRLVLYLRISDAADFKVFRVLPVGPLLSFSRPEAQIDKLSQLHLLFQIGARSFSYLMIDPDGKILLRQTHDYTATRPVLRSNSQGRIFVNGGMRRYTEGDYPLPWAAATNEVEKPKP
jgi:hypothetical protein